MKQTAVEWFWLNLTDDLIGDLAPEKILKIHKLIIQAKAMEKGQIIQAYETAMETDIYNEPLKIGKDYYNETFKTE